MSNNYSLGSQCFIQNIDKLQQTSIYAVLRETTVIYMKWYDLTHTMYILYNLIHISISSYIHGVV